MKMTELEFSIKMLTNDSSQDINTYGQDKVQELQW